jgi:hypothetical protein
MGPDRAARVAAVIWDRLLASAGGLAAGPARRGRRWRACFRVVAACVAAALFVAGLAAPGSVARAAPVPVALTPTGGDFSATMPYTGVSQATASYLVSTALPQALGLPANPTPSQEMTTAYETSAGGIEAATGVTTGPPVSFTGGSVSVTSQGVSATVPGPVLGANDPANPAGPAAVTAAAAVTFAATAVGFVSCLAVVGAVTGVTAPQQFSTQQLTSCLAVGVAAGAAAAGVLIATWYGIQIASGGWVAIVVAVLSTGLFSGYGLSAVTPWILAVGGYLAVKLRSGSQAMYNGLKYWLPKIWSIVSGAFGSLIGKAVAVTASLWNSRAAAAGLPTMAAEGPVQDNALGTRAECMTVWGSRPYPYSGEAVAINTCNGGLEQQWTEWSNGELTNGGLCLDITNDSFASRSPLEVYECHGGGNQAWEQKWFYVNGKPAIWNDRAAMCVDDPDWVTTPGTQLQDEWCTGTSAEQWLMPGSTSGTGTFPIVTGYGVIDPGAGECADAYGSSNGASPGQIVAINGCNGNPAQDWTTWSDGTITVWGLCMDTTGGTSSLGTPLVDLETCDGAASQEWTPQPDGALLNSASGTCLDDPSSNTTAGTELDVYPCNGTPAQQWTLPGPPPPDTAPPPPSALGDSVCDIYASYGTPCAAAYSMTRALYSDYDGPLYQVQRTSDGTTADIGLLAAGGDVNASEQDSFCAGTTCTITQIYDQSADGNNLAIEQGGGASAAPDQGAVASALPITIGGNKAYGLDIEPGTGYRDDLSMNVAIDGAPEGMYMVASGTHVNQQCCFDFGNVETDNDDNGQGHMDAVNLTTYCGSYVHPCAGSGPWVEADMENGQWTGNGPNPADTGNGSDFVTAMLKNDGQANFELEGGNGQSGDLTTYYDGALPSGYSPMQQEGGIVLGTGGDNSDSDVGSFFEGVMTEGFPSDAADAAVQANIVAAGYAGNSSPPATASAPASAAGQAVVHSAGATGAGASGFSSVYTVDSANGHLQETYLPYMGDAWTSQDLSANYGTPPVMPGTQPVAIVHCGFTSVYTVDASNGDLQETYLAAIGDAWATQDLSAEFGTPPTDQTPTAVVHSAGATGAAAACGFTSVYTVDRNDDLQETYLPVIGSPWNTQDLSANYGTPAVQPGTSPVAIVHCGFTSVYTVDAADHHLQETYLAAIGDAWGTQDLSANYGTPTTTTTPTAVVHTAGASGATDDCGFTSVYTVDQGSQDLQETYLPNAGFPGDPWNTQNLSANYGTPAVAPGTQPEALVHMGYTSVYTVDQGSDQLQETYLAAIGDAWGTQSLSANYGAPTTDQTPIVLLHPDASGNLDWASVYTVNEFNNDLQETYLSNTGFPGDPWVTQDLSANYGTPTVAVLQSSQASWTVDHSGFTSAYTVDEPGGDLQETYLPAMGDSWNTQDLSASYHTPAVWVGTEPTALVHDGYTSVYTIDAGSGDLQETYLPAVGDSWGTQDLSAIYHTPAVSPGSSPAAVFHDGNTSVYTVDEATGDLQETYLPGAGFPGDPWVTQDLSAIYHTPAVMPGTSPVAIFHDGLTSVYTIDAHGQLWETILPVMGGPWYPQNLSAEAHTPPTSVSPTAVFHDGYISVYTVDAVIGDLQETYLPAIGDAWLTQDLSASTSYSVPTALNIAPVALYHTGYTSVYYIGASGSLEEAYLPAIGGPWYSQSLSVNYHTPASATTPSPLVHYAANGGLTWTSVFTIDGASSQLQETYLPAIGDPWTTQELPS